MERDRKKEIRLLAAIFSNSKMRDVKEMSNQALLSEALETYSATIRPMQGNYESDWWPKRRFDEIKHELRLRRGLE